MQWRHHHNTQQRRAGNTLYAVQSTFKDMLTDWFQDPKCPELWPQLSDIKGDGGETNVEFKTRAGGHPDFELTNQ